MSDGAPAGRLVAAAAVIAALVAVASAGVTTGATVAGFAGVLGLGWGLHRSARPLATVGAVSLFGAVVLAAAADAGPGQLLAAGAATVLAWTFAHAAIDLRRSVGTAPSRDHEVAHVAGTTAILAGGALPIYLVYSVDWGTVPPLAVALLLVAALSLTVAIGR